MPIPVPKEGLPPSPSRPIIAFALFELDLASRELRRQGVKIKLQEQPFKILELLLENAAEIVSRETIRDRIWPADTFVDFDHGLTNTSTSMPDIAGALGDHLPDAAIQFALQRLVDAVGDLKDDLLARINLNQKIPGTDKTLNDIFGEGGLAAFLALDDHVAAFIQSVDDWTSHSPVEIGGRLIDYLRDHWLSTLPGFNAATGVGPVRLEMIKSNGEFVGFRIAFDGSAQFTREFGFDLASQLNGANIAVDGDIALAVHAVAELAFTFEVNWRDTTANFRLDRLRVDAGIDANDIVAFHITCRAEAVNDAVDLLSDFVGRAHIDAEELDRERGVVIQEINRSDDVPSSVADPVIFSRSKRLPVGGPPMSMLSIPVPSWE